MAVGWEAAPHRGGGYFERVIAKTNGLWVTTERSLNTHDGNNGLDYPPEAFHLLYTAGDLPDPPGPVRDTPAVGAPESEWEAFRDYCRVRAAIACDRERLLRDPADYVFAWETASRNCWDHLAGLTWLPSAPIAPLRLMARIGEDLRDTR